jgi:hypothetical protein
MDDARPVFPHIDAQEIVDLERATGLLIDDEEDWSPEDYDAVIAYLRRKALLPPAFIPKPRRDRFSCCRPTRAQNASSLIVTTAMRSFRHRFILALTVAISQLSHGIQTRDHVL